MEPSLTEAPLVRSRRQARIAAMQAVYEIEYGRATLEQAIESALERRPFAPETAAFIRELVTGLYANRREVDELIGRHLASGWSIDRIASTDRGVLRVAVFELLHLPSMPPKVTISEAVAIAKEYGSADSGKFVNGVLGGLLPETPKREWNPADHPAYEPEEEPPPPPLDVDETTDIPEEGETTIVAGSEEHQRLSRVGSWSLRQDD